jgi:hypothetical protein
MTFSNFGTVAQKHSTDLANVEVQSQTKKATFELQQFVGHCRMQSLYARNAVTSFNNVADFFAGGARCECVNIARDGIADLFRADREFRHGVLLSSFRMVRYASRDLRACSSRDVTLPSMTSSPI